MWHGFWRGPEAERRVSLDRALLRRVLQSALPYRWSIGLMVLAILLTSVTEALQPQLVRVLVDRALPAPGRSGDLLLLTLLSIGMVALPLLGGLIGVWQRQLSARRGRNHL
jgi:ATP-binding cassette subfamily B protein